MPEAFRDRIAKAIFCRFLARLGRNDRLTRERRRRAERDTAREAVLRWPKALCRAGFIERVPAGAPEDIAALEMQLCRALTGWILEYEPHPSQEEDFAIRQALPAALRLLGIPPTDPNIDEAIQVVGTGPGILLAYRRTPAGHIRFRPYEVKELLKPHLGLFRSRARSWMLQGCRAVL